MLKTPGPCSGTVAASVTVTRGVADSSVDRVVTSLGGTVISVLLAEGVEDGRDSLVTTTMMATDASDAASNIASPTVRRV